MTLFQVSYERFQEEIRFEKITDQDKNQLELEDLGTSFAFYLSSLDRNKEFVYVVKKDEFTDVQKVQLFPISRESVRIRDTTQLKIIEALNRIKMTLQKNPRERIIERETIEITKEE